MTARSVLGAAAARLVLSAQFVGEDALLAVLERDPSRLKARIAALEYACKEARALLAQAEDADDGA